MISAQSLDTFKGVLGDIFIPHLLAVQHVFPLLAPTGSFTFISGGAADKCLLADAGLITVTFALYPHALGFLSIEHFLMCPIVSQKYLCLIF